MSDKIGRRSLLKLLGIAPVLAPAAGVAAQTSVLRGLAYEGVGAVMESGHSPDEGSWKRTLMPKVIWQRYFRKRDDLQVKFNRETVYRLGVLDPNVAAMRSWAPAFALSVQKRRDMEVLEEIERLRNELWPDFL